MTIPQPIAFFPAAADHAAGKDTPRDFLERCLARLEEFEPAVGAFVHRCSAHRRDAGGVPTCAAADKQRRALFGRHVGGLDDVFDAERHAVDRRQGSAAAPALGGPVRGGARCSDVVTDKRPDGWLEFLEARQTAFEEVAGRILAGRVIRGGRKKKRWAAGSSWGAPIS